MPPEYDADFPYGALVDDMQAVSRHTVTTNEGGYSFMVDLSDEDLNIGGHDAQSAYS